MNAVHPVQSSIAAAAEPSMEEILASIRRIIADDQSFPGRPHMETQVPDLAQTLAAEDGDAAEPAGTIHEPPTPSGLDDEPSHDAPQGEGGEPSAFPRGHGFIAPQFVSPEGPRVDRAGPAEVAGVGSADDDPHGRAASGDPSFGIDEEPTIARAAASDRLFSPAIDNSVTAAFNTLAASRLVASSDELVGLVREMIRPLLKAWIDENLPGLVERLVKAEIERLSRNGS